MPPRQFPPRAEPSDPDTATLLRQAVQLAQHVRDAEERAQALRTLRDRAVLQLLERGMSTRRLGAHLGLTATQVSAIWRRTRPARPSGRRAGDRLAATPSPSPGPTAGPGPGR